MLPVSFRDINSFQVSDRAGFRSLDIIVPELALGESDRIIARECQKNSAFIIGEKGRSLFCQFINGVIRPQQYRKFRSDPGIFR